MCGIVGYIQTDKKINADVLSSMRDALAYRGPDDFGAYISTDGKVGLAHRRLSFLDLSPEGKQPLTTADSLYTVTFNGEIYNYRELKVELENLGFKFTTHTDTEVLLHGYKAWGNALPSKLKGMFAFVIYDSLAKKLFLARDRFGIKPLFYAVANNLFMFSSEIKGLFLQPDFVKKINKQAVSLFLANRYIPTPYSMWENVYKLAPATWMEVDVETLEKKSYAYWNLEPGKNKIPKAEMQQRFHDMISTSMDEHLRSDVQIGSFLSGGMDSSALVLLMKESGYQPLDAFAIGFENWEESEHHYAKQVSDALGTNLHSLILEKISMETVSTLMYHYDDPIADISILPTYAVSGLASQHVKAVVSGEGADECLGGYWWQHPSRFWYSSRWRNIRSKITGNSFADIKAHYIQAMSMGLYDKNELQEALTEEWQNSIPDDPFVHFDQFEKTGIGTLKQIQYLDIKTFMSELILTKVDRASMAHSLEVRVPFLDHELVEFIFSLSEDVYFNGHIQKEPIRHLLQGKVPSKIYERKKQGFVGPDQFYMDMEIYRKALLNGRLINDSVIKPTYLDKLFETKDHWRLWKLFVLENWWQIWI